MTRKGRIRENELNDSLLALIKNKPKGFIGIIKQNEWEEDENNLFQKTINHGLNSQNIIINFVDADKNKSEFVSYTIIDDNNIKIEIENKINLKVLISTILI